MASYITPVIHGTNDVLAVTDYNAVANNTTFLYQRPYIYAFNSVTTSLVNDTATQVTLGGLAFSGYGFSVSSNNVVVPLTGIYQVSCGILVTTSATGVLFAQVWQNGSAKMYGAVSNLNTTTGGLTTGTGLLNCSANDTIGLYGLQTSGNVQATSTGSPATYLAITLVGSQ